MNEVPDHELKPNSAAKSAMPKYHSQFRRAMPVLQSPNITYPTE